VIADLAVADREKEDRDQEGVKGSEQRHKTLSAI
jgi:hypothetical protein